MSFNIESGIIWVTMDKYSVKSVFQCFVAVKNPDIRIIDLWQKKKNLDKILSDTGKNDSKLRTQVRMGYEDLLLFIKNIGEPFWKKTPINHYSDPDKPVEYNTN